MRSGTITFPKPVRGKRRYNDGEVKAKVLSMDRIQCTTQGRLAWIPRGAPPVIPALLAV